jgi:hypothetical protein
MGEFGGVPQELQLSPIPAGSGTHPKHFLGMEAGSLCISALSRALHQFSLPFKSLLCLFFYDGVSVIFEGELQHPFPYSHLAYVFLGGEPSFSYEPMLKLRSPYTRDIKPNLDYCEYDEHP